MLDPSLVIACRGCDLLHRVQPLPPHGVARCGRCGSILYRHAQHTIDQTLALCVTGILLFVLANLFPLLVFNLHGQVQEATFLTGVKTLEDQGWTGLAAIVLATGMFAPFLHLAGMIYVLLPIRLNRRLPGQALVLRIVQRLEPWSMTEVVLIGVLVAFVKLSDMATIVPGVSLYAFAALILVTAAAMTALEPRSIWERLKAQP